MAGGPPGKKDPKNQKVIDGFNSEVLKDSQSNRAPEAPVKFSLKGVLGLGQTIEFGKPLEKKSETFWGGNNLEHAQNVLFSHHQEELVRALKDLRVEIANLFHKVDSVEKSTQAAVLNEIVEASEYQVTTLVRIRNYIIGLTQSVSDIGIWVQSFAAKKKKRNYFWNTAKDKKKGGINFMFSDESGVARSVG